MAFEVKNPTLKNIINFLKNLSNVATDEDISIGDTNNWYGRKNGVWSKIQNSGGGGEESTNIGDEVYLDGQQLVIKSSSTEVEDFFGQIADNFNDSLSYSTDDLVMYNKELYRFTSNYTAGSGDSLTTHATTTTINMGLQQKASINREILYFPSQNVGAGTNSSIMRIPSSGTDSRISTSTIVLECVFTNPNYIISDITWQSYNGYIQFTGTCSTQTSANVVLGYSGN